MTFGFVDRRSIRLSYGPRARDRRAGRRIVGGRRDAGPLGRAKRDLRTLCRGQATSRQPRACLRARLHRRPGGRAGAHGPGLCGEAVSDPVGLDATHARDRERVLVNRFSTRLGDDPEPGEIVVFHPPSNATDGACRPAGLPPTSARTVSPAPSPAPSRRRRTSSSASSPAPATRWRSRTGSRSSTASRSRATGRSSPATAKPVQLPHADHDPRRRLLHDGRQPAEQRGQPLLGPVPRDGSSARPSSATGRPIGSGRCRTAPALLLHLLLQLHRRRLRRGSRRWE